jgi:hypothetical protein
LFLDIRDHPLIFSGKRLLTPASEAAQIPRSVMNPVTSRAGVTSKA